MLIFCFIVGAIVGSFLNVVIARLPHGEQSVAFPRSYCPACKKTIAARDLIPILSYILLRAKCRWCEARISWRYPFIETLSGILAVLLVLRYGPTPVATELFVFSCALICVAFIDLDTYLIPLSLSVFLGVVGLLFGWFNAATLIFQMRVLGALFGLLSFASVLVISTYVLRKLGRIGDQQTAMGWGDVLLVGGIGANLGLFNLPWVILLSSLQAILVLIVLQVFSLGSRAVPDDTIPQNAIPFGPFLSLAAIQVGLWG